MKFYIYGSKETTNNRIGMLEKVLDRKKIKYICGGGMRNKLSKVFDLMKVFCCDTLYMGSFSHANTRIIKVAKMLRKNVIVDYYASYFDMNVIDRKKYSPESNEGKLQLSADCKAVSLADELIFLNRAECEYYLSVTECSRFRNKAKIVPLVIESRQKARLSYYKNHGGTFNIVFCGTYIPLHGIQVIIDAVEILAAKCNNVHLYLWGNENTIQASSEWQSQVKVRQLGRYITFLNKWDKKNYYEWCADNCALMLGVFGESKKAYTVVPNKVVDALAFGIPCITGESTGCREFFDGEEDIFLVPHTAAALADAISEVMKEDYTKVMRRVELMDDVYIRHFSEEAFDKEIGNLIEDLQIKQSLGRSNTNG